MFLNIRAEYVDNKIMKNLRKILTFFILLTLTACMPDSLTKFKEAPTKKEADSTSSGGSGGTTVPSPSTCSVGVDIECTSPGLLNYTETELEVLLADSGAEFVFDPIIPFFSSLIIGHEAYITIAPDDAGFKAKTTLDFDTQLGTISGDPDIFLPKTTFVFTSTFSTPELASDELSTDSITFTFATDLASIEYPTLIGQKLILEVDDVSSFSTTAGLNFISTASGASGNISFIDTQNKEIHLEITSNSGTGTFLIDKEIDNNVNFFSSKAVIIETYYAFDKSSSIQTLLNPNVKGFDPLSPSEINSLTYSISPALPDGLSFNKLDGTIGTLRAYQILNSGILGTVAGNRTITGIFTAFLTELQVGSQIEINGDLHEVESITSDTEFATYSPQETTATPGSLKKLLKGSVELTNGSAAIIGYGTDFSSEVVVTEGLYIDAIGTFTGLVNAPITVVSSTGLTLGAVFAGTALTIPTVKATEYTISAKNILNKSISTVIEIGLLDIVQPKTISDIVYINSVNDERVIKVTDASSFVVGGYITNQKNAIARIDFINPSNQNLFVTLQQIGNECSNTLYTTSGTCTAAGHSWIQRSFEEEDNVDNSSSFFSAETTISSEPIRVFPISLNTITITPFVLPTTLSAPELATLVYSITPNISSGQGFCSESTYSSEFDCNSDPLALPGSPFVWTEGLSFDTSTGIITGTVHQAIPETTFEVSVENLVGRTTTSSIIISANESPTGMAVTRNVLLHVPSNSAFEIGDAITTNNNAIGTITGKFRINASNTEKGLFQFEYLEVRVDSGSFEEFDDLDNIPLFASQKTYVLGSGVYNYNTKASVTTNTNSLKDPEYSSYVKHESLLQIGGSDRANIIFNDEVNDNLYLLAYDKNTYAANVEPSYLTTGDTFTAANIPGTPSVIISGIEANNLKLQTDSAPAGLTSNFSKGHDITSTSNAGIGILHDFTISGGNNYSYVSVTEGVFSTAANIEAASPFATSAATITGTGVAAENAFYFYRRVPATIEIQLYNTDSTTVIELDKALPAGLTTEIENGNIVRITGTPTGPSAKEKFTLTATNPYGSTKVEFFLKVYDQLILTDTTGSLSYILHKTGKGNGRKPCSITEEQMLYGDIAVKDISCFLDVGENELHWNGVQMNLQIGDNLCQFIDEKPTAFWQFSGGDAGAELGTSIYKHSGFSSCNPLSQPAGEYTTDEPGTALMSAIADARILIPIETPKNLCMFNYNEQYDDADLPSCDNGVIPQFTVAWNATAFECENSGGFSTADSTVIECEDNNGTCAGGIATGVESSRTDCEIADPGLSVWTPNGSHNDGGGLFPAQGTCVADAAVQQADVECGGEPRNCISGARRTSSVFSTQDIIDGVTTYIYTMSGTTPKNEINFDYTSGYEGGELGTNIWFSNYYNACNADLYKPNTTSQQNSMDSTLSTTNYLGAGSQSTYEYVCKSGSGTIKARVRMIVRDFDRDFKVKLGYCANIVDTNKADCNAAGSAWTDSGIDYYNPDIVAGAPVSGDGRHVLRNEASDAFADPYNRYFNNQDYIGAGYTCGAAPNSASTVTFPASGNTNYPEQSL